MKKTITKLFALLGLVSSMNAQIIVDFDNLTLPTDSFYYNATTDNWTTGPLTFDYHYNSGWDYWESGSAYTNVQDTANGTYTNLYGCASYTAYSGNNYVTLQGGANLKIAQPYNVFDGFYVNNTTYAYKTIKNGNQFSRKFGDTTGTNSGGVFAQGEYPDWFKLTIKGYFQGIQTGTKDVYLADYTAAGTANDFIIKDWQYVDFSTSFSGYVDSLSFSLSSSDNSTFGMNTPSFFSIDNVGVTVTVGLDEQKSITNLSVFPNPVKDVLMVNYHAKNTENLFVTITDVSGKVIYTETLNVQLGENNFKINSSHFDKGVYFIQLSNSQSNTTKKFIKL